TRSHTLLALAYDAAGTAGPPSATVTTRRPDTQAPAVRIAAPAAGATLTAVTTVQVTATDNVGVARTEFFVDNVRQATDTAAPYAFSLDPSRLATGSHSLMALAYDAAGNRGQATVTVTTRRLDTLAPSVRITAPAAGATLTRTTAVQVTATDNVGVARVDFYVDNVRQFSDTTAPFAFSLDPSRLADGRHTLMALGYDQAGNRGQATVTVTTRRPDTQAPAVRITAPAAGATLTAVAAVQVTANENVSGSRVEFAVDHVRPGTEP